MRILSARIFSKFFGGKNYFLETGVTHGSFRLVFFLKKKKAHAYFGARIFLSLLAGKLTMLTRKQLLRIKA